MTQEEFFRVVVINKRVSPDMRAWAGQGWAWLLNVKRGPEEVQSTMITAIMTQLDPVLDMIVMIDNHRSLIIMLLCYK